MNKLIPPEDRYSQHAKVLEISRGEVEKAIARAGGEPRESSIRKLSGGFQNANYFVEGGGKISVFRFYSAGAEAAEREAGVLDFLKDRDVAAPALLDFFAMDGRHVAVLEFIDGELLQDLLRTSSRIAPALFRNIGAAIGKVHAIEFGRAGFLGAELKIGGEFDSFAPFARAYIERVLGEVPAEKLDHARRDRCLALVAEQWHLVLETEPAKSLVHSDFNPKNILVSRAGDGQVAALLDWEFSFSGNGYIDLGNFFRFAHDYPPGAEAEFLAGYDAGRGREAHPRWRDIGRLLDLANMCSFLERKEDYPKTFRTARVIIESTLAHFQD